MDLDYKQITRQYILELVVVSWGRGEALLSNILLQFSPEMRPPLCKFLLAPASCNCSLAPRRQQLTCVMEFSCAWIAGALWFVDRKSRADECEKMYKGT